MEFFNFRPAYAEPEELAKALKGMAKVSHRFSVRHLLDSIGWQSVMGKGPLRVPEVAIGPLVAISSDIARSFTMQTERLQQLGDRWEEAVNQADADAIAMEPLQFGLKAMFVVEGIYRVLDQYPDDPRVQAAATELAKAYDAYDEALLDHIGVLCTLADGDALERLRKSLPEACTTMPWWLAGALEAAAERLVEETDSMVEEYAKRLGDS